MVFIAHRLAAVTKCDRIITLERGRIVEDGTPESLLSKTDGFFARMLRYLEQSGVHTMNEMLISRPAAVAKKARPSCTGTMPSSCCRHGDFRGVAAAHRPRPHPHIVAAIAAALLWSSLAWLDVYTNAPVGYARCSGNSRQTPRSRAGSRRSAW